MKKQWIYWVNLSLAGLSGFFVLLALGLYFTIPSKIHVEELSLEKATLPKNPFSMKKESYDAIGPPFMSLEYSPLTLQLPDLRNLLTYYGRNERPDASIDQALLHFAFTGTRDIVSIPAGKPLYLVYDQDQPKLKYRFSPDNIETSLWIEGTPQEKEVIIDVSMKNEAGEILRKPKMYTQFKIRERELTRFGGEKWTLGKWKVDGTLLARQRARWYGQDLFLEKHGGVEYKEQQGKQRLDFGEGDDVYSASVGVGEALAWIDNRWHEVLPGKETLEFPLLVVNKVDERLMRLDLWDVAGKGKITLNLIKSTETQVPQNIEKVFKFVGARTRSQLLFEIKGERIVISPYDWLLFVDGDWKKLTTPKEIDDYVERKIVGPLFVIDGVERENGRQVLQGTIFNSTRTGMKAVEVPLLQGAAPGIFESRSSGEKNSSSIDDDEDDLENSEALVEELKGYRRYIDKFRERYKGEVPSPEEFNKSGAQWSLQHTNASGAQTKPKRTG